MQFCSILFSKFPLSSVWIGLVQFGSVLVRFGLVQFRTVTCKLKKKTWPRIQPLPSCDSYLSSIIAFYLQLLWSVCHWTQLSDVTVLSTKHKLRANKRYSPTYSPKLHHTWKVTPAYLTPTLLIYLLPFNHMNSLMAQYFFVIFVGDYLRIP